MQFSVAVGSDTRLDQSGNFDDLLNRLPSGCPKCGFPDIDTVPSPYYIHRSRARVNSEVALAELGNFLVRRRAKAILETAVPGQCRYFATNFVNSDELAPWELAVPVHYREGCAVKSTIERCVHCHEPTSAHWGTQFAEYGANPEHDITKDRIWHSKGSDIDWKGRGKIDGGRYWIDRQLNFSRRLWHLLRAANVKGIVPFMSDFGELETLDNEWLAIQLAKLQLAGIELRPPGAVSDEDAKWFRRYLRTQSSTNPSRIDQAILTKRLKCKLPNSLRGFLERVGPQRFSDVDGVSGFNVQIVAWDDIDRQELVQEVADGPGDGTFVGIRFAVTGHGDCFYLQFKLDRNELPVFRYNHELDTVEEYAANFVSCLRRWTS